MEAFYWMFKKKDFKNHFFILCGIVVFSLLISFMLLHTSCSVDKFNIYITTKILGVAFILLPIFYLLGYFWILTDSIVNRNWDISSSSIYSGKIKFVNDITLPELSFFKILWRGISSIVASILLFFPIVLLCIYNIKNNAITVSFFNFDFNQTVYFYSFAYFIIASFIPALAWNYAVRDSILAVWNFPKAIFIIGNYTYSYWKNTIIFIIVTTVNCLFFAYLLNILGVSIVLGVNGLNSMSISNNNIFISLIIMILLIFLLNIYSIFVNSYLLGTIAPPSENY